MNVEAINSLKVGSETARQAPRVVEIVGPAGTGKTTLCQALLRASAQTRTASFPDVRSLRALPFFLWNGLAVIRRIGPFLLGDSRRVTAREFAWLCILNGWPGLLQNDWASRHHSIVLDQGPIYLFSELRESGPQHVQTKLSNGTWQTMYDRWATTLDAIVWLDAPDAILVQRIRGREKVHLVKEQSDNAVVGFLHSFRSAYDHTISLLAARNPSLTILRFDTSMRTAGELACDLVAALHL
jgi:shikimate kinase